ncbi:hypothetical protein [Nocardia sp. NPDC058497]|uniref:hypothetical protein n=1 Tax=Nocardia sp. NPDC058497 TaxID=3346529 RepID=UPI003662D563
MSDTEVPHAGTSASGSTDSKLVPDSATRRCRELADRQAGDELLTAGDDVVSAAQIVVSYLWNTEYERTGSGPASHIMQQLRTLTRWLTAPPRD